MACINLESGQGSKVISLLFRQMLMLAFLHLYNDKDLYGSLHSSSHSVFPRDLILLLDSFSIKGFCMLAQNIVFFLTLRGTWSHLNETGCCTN